MWIIIIGLTLRCENIDKAEIIRMPKIVIRDKGYGSFEYPFGTMHHDNMYTDGHYIYYRNLQNGEGSDHAFSDYEIVKTAEDGSLDTIKVIAVTPDIFPEAEPVQAGRCEICNKLLYLDSRYGDDANFAENAHIHAVGKTGPRHVDDMTQDEINNIDNLMLLCAEHHHLIDTKPENYPSDFLIVQKKNHENRIRRLTEIQDSDSCKMVTFFSNIASSC